MIRTGAAYKDGLRDGREFWMDGERVTDVTTHAAFKPMWTFKARMYDLHHEEATKAPLTYVEDNAVHSVFHRPPTTQQDWQDKWRRWTSCSRLWAASSPASATRPSARCGRCRTVATSWRRSIRASPPYRQPHPPGGGGDDPLPRFRQHRPQGRPLAPHFRARPDMMVHVTKETDAASSFAAPNTRPPPLMRTRPYLKPTGGRLDRH